MNVICYSEKRNESSGEILKVWIMENNKNNMKCLICMNTMNL